MLTRGGWRAGWRQTCPLGGVARGSVGVPRRVRVGVVGCAPETSRAGTRGWSMRGRGLAVVRHAHVHGSFCQVQEHEQGDVVCWSNRTLRFLFCALNGYWQGAAFERSRTLAQRTSLLCLLQSPSHRSGRFGGGHCSGGDSWPARFYSSIRGHGHLSVSHASPRAARPPPRTKEEKYTKVGCAFQTGRCTDRSSHIKTKVKSRNTAGATPHHLRGVARAGARYDASVTATQARSSTKERHRPALERAVHILDSPGRGRVPATPRVPRRRSRVVTASTVAAVDAAVAVVVAIVVLVVMTGRSLPHPLSHRHPAAGFVCHVEPLEAKVRPDTKHRNPQQQDAYIARHA